MKSKVTISQISSLEIASYPLYKQHWLLSMSVCKFTRFNPCFGGAGRGASPQPPGVESLAKNSQFPPLTFLTVSNLVQYYALYTVTEKAYDQVRV